MSIEVLVDDNVFVQDILFTLLVSRYLGICLLDQWLISV